MHAIVSRPTNDRLHVYVLVENRLVRETLVRLFQRCADFRVVGQGSSREANEVRNSQCDIVLLDDLQTASLLVPSLLDRLHTARTMRALLIGMEDDEEQFLDAVRAGVAGYLLHDASPSDVISAVRAVARGEAVCPPHLCLALFSFVAQAASEAPQTSQEPMRLLTLLQQQVISLVAKGLTNKEIASQMNLSEFTIKNHIHRIMKQLEVESRYEMVRVVRTFGYVGLA